MDVAALTAMSPAQLRAEWRRVHRASPPKLGPDLLARGVAWRMQERIHGGLAPSTLRALTRLADRLARNNTDRKSTRLNSSMRNSYAVFCFKNKKTTHVYRQ